MADLVGTTLQERYYLRRLVGSGGVADVYLAWDKLRSTKLAIKVLRESPADHAFLFQMASREAEVLRKLEHPYIVRLYEFLRAEQQAYLVMDWVEGTNLRQTIRERTAPLPLGEVAKIIEPVCSALHYAHQNQVYHCDIKPANILLHVDGRVLLTDFGVARLALDQQSGGTPPYMAPEQFLGHEVAAPTDVYGLGITVYEALSGGKVPFRGESSHSRGTTLRDRIKWEHCNMPLPSLRKFNTAVPNAVVQVIEKALSKDPGQRHPSVMALKDDFEQARAYAAPADETMYQTIQPPPPARVPPPRPLVQPSPPAQPSPPVRPEPYAGKGPHLLCQAGEWRGRVLPLGKGNLKVGRSTDSHVRFRERSVSRYHATIIRTRRGVYIRDENSMTGTYVNGQQVSGPRPLKHGDTLRFGYYQEFQFRER